MVPFIAVIAVGCAGPTTSSDQVAQPVNVTGTWVGSYQTGGNSGHSTLVLNQEGAQVTGTVQATNVDRSFGAAPRSIQEGRLSGRALSFTSVGADGSVFRADFTVSRDGQEISGWGRHTGPGYDANVQFSHKKK